MECCSCCHSVGTPTTEKSLLKAARRVGHSTFPNMFTRLESLTIMVSEVRFQIHGSSVPHFGPRASHAPNRPTLH